MVFLGQTWIVISLCMFMDFFERSADQIIHYWKYTMNLGQ